jgi:hypothetical protein
MNHSYTECPDPGRRTIHPVYLLALGYFLLAVGGTAVAAQTPDNKALDSDPQLAGWWKFDETTGTTAADSSKRKHTGNLEGEFTFDANSVDGRIGKALKLNGRDDLVRITGYKGVTGTGPRTITIWIKTEVPNGEIVSWGRNDFGQMWILRFIRKHAGVTPNGGYYYMSGDIHDGEWHHVAVVVREAELPNLHDDVTLYLDGEIAEIDRIGLLDLWPIETGSEQDVTIGKRFKGALDDLRIYARALSDEEIQMIYRRAK